MNVTEKIKEIISVLVKKETVSEDDDLKDDLFMDSLGTVIMLVDIENAFGIQLQDEDLDVSKISTVQSVIEILSKYEIKKAEENIECGGS